MNSYKDITNRYLKHNKKRTMLTILGVILSVALITSIGLFIKSFQNSFVQNQIEKSGAFHLQFYKMDNETYGKLKSNPKIEKIGIRESFDNATLRDSKSINIEKFNENAMKLTPYKIIEGSFPKQEGEIAIESWILNYIDNNPKVGDNINLKLKNGSMKKFKLTGMISNNPLSQFEGMSLGIIYSNKFNIDNSKVYVTISEKAGISNTVKEITNTFKNINTNKDLLDYLGEGQNNKVNNQLYSIVSIVVVVVIIATIAVIYNSFQISVVERIKQFGLLRAVGATPKQIKSVVLREATIIILIGVPFGLLSGILAMFLITKIFGMICNQKETFGSLKLVVPYYVLLISSLVGVISIYVSALIPAFFAAKISPLVAISSRTSIVKEKIKKKRGSIAKKFLNINSLMAFKNIKRNRKRFNITVFSMVISVALFIFFSSFINMTMNFTDEKSESNKTDFIVEGVNDKNGNSSLTRNMVEKINENELVKETLLNYGTYTSKALIDNEKKDKQANDMENNIYEKSSFEGKEMFYVKTICDIFDENKLNYSKNYLKSGEINIDKMSDENGVILVKDNLFVSKDNKKYIGELTKLKVGDYFYIDKNLVSEDILDFSNIKNKTKNNSINFEKSNIIKLKIYGIVDNSPYMGLPTSHIYTKTQYLKLIVPKDVFKNIYGKSIETMPLKSTEIVLKDKTKEKQFEKWFQPLVDSNGAKYINCIELNKTISGSILQTKILLYGFIAVISLIGIVNIINTITTNLILRKKETASLSALGMSYKDIRSMILTEGTLYGLYGAFYGGIVGIVLSYGLFSVMRALMDFKWHIPWISVIIAIVTSIAIGLLAVIRPLNRIKKENIIEVIRAEQ